MSSLIIFYLHFREHSATKQNRISLELLLWSFFIFLKTLLLSMCCAVLSRSVMSYSLWPHGVQFPGFFVHEDSPGKNTEILLQGIFPRQGLNPGLPHCRQILYQLSYQGSSFIEYNWYFKKWYTKRLGIFNSNNFISVLLPLNSS